MLSQTGAEIVANISRMSAAMQQTRPGRAGVAAIVGGRKRAGDSPNVLRVGRRFF